MFILKLQTFLNLIQPFIPFTDPQDRPDQIKMAALAAHRSSFLLFPGWILTARMYCTSATTLRKTASQSSEEKSPTELTFTLIKHSVWRICHICRRTDTHTRPPRVPAAALKQFIEASLHGHSFWNSNCYLIRLQVLSPLHLRVTLAHLWTQTLHWLMLWFSQDLHGGFASGEIVIIQSLDKHEWFLEILGLNRTGALFEKRSSFCS